MLTSERHVHILLAFRIDLLLKIKYVTPMPYQCEA